MQLGGIEEVLVSCLVFKRKRVSINAQEEEDHESKLITLNI